MGPRWSRSAYTNLEAIVSGLVIRACLWEDDIGSLEVGKKADIVLVDRFAIESTHPGRDPIHSLVYSANGSSVDTVIIDGRTVMRGREILTVDEEKITRDVVAAGKAWMARAGVGPTCPWPAHG